MERHELQKKTDTFFDLATEVVEEFDSWDVAFDLPSEQPVMLDASVLAKAHAVTIQPEFEDGKFVRNRIVVLYPHGLYYPDEDGKPQVAG